MRSGKASWRHSGNALAVNSAKAREKVDSLGTAPARSQPHKHRSCGSLPSRSTSARVASTSRMALTTKDVASAARFCDGRSRPRQPVLHAPQLQHPHVALVAIAQQAEYLGQTWEQPVPECEPLL